MRKRDQLSDRHQIIRNQRRWLRKLRSRRKLKLRRRGFSPTGEALAVTVKFPPAISIQNKRARKMMVGSLRKMKGSIGNKPLYLDFRDTYLQFPSGVLLLVSEIDRQKRILGSKFNVEILLPEDKVSRQVFYQVGIAALCGKEKPATSEKFDESVRHWRYATGARMTDVPGKALERFEGQLSDELQSGMWKGVSEAIINSIQHAYLEERCDGFRECTDTRWWMFSQVRDNELTVAVCDLGIGIPRSLPLRWEKAKIEKLLAKFNLASPEVSAVRAALEVGATRTGDDHRGRGLPQIWQDMKSHEGSRVLLLSNRALLHWNNSTQTERHSEFSDSIFGTMVMWSVPLEVTK